MTVQERTEQRRLEQAARLDDLMFQWKTLPEAGNEAVRQRLYQNAWVAWFELYDEGREGLEHDLRQDVFIQTMTNYHPYNEKGERQNFSNFYNYKLPRERVDARKKAKRERPPDDDGETMDGNGNIRSSPLDDPNNQVGNGTNTDSENPGDKAQFYDAFDRRYVELSTMILNFYERHHERTGKDIRYQWYRLFFTEDMTRTWKETAFQFSHLRDIYEAMEWDYLDFYMRDVCRSDVEVRMTPLKPYGDVVPARAEERYETPVPLPADVSLSFLTHTSWQYSVSETTRSNYIKSYREETGRIPKAVDA